MGAVGLAYKRLSILRKEFSRCPVQCAAGMRAAVSVGMQPTLVADQKALFLMFAGREYKAAGLAFVGDANALPLLGFMHAVMMHAESVKTRWPPVGGHQWLERATLSDV